MTAEAALQGPAVEASKSGSHTLTCPEEQGAFSVAISFFLPKLTVDQTSAGGSSLVAGERISADFVLPEKTLTSRSAVTKGTCVTGRSQGCSDSTVRGTEQASQDPPEDVSANSSTSECPRENVRSCVPVTMSPSMKYKQTIKHLQAKVAAQRKTIKRLRRQPHQTNHSFVAYIVLVTRYEE
ncbi:uncharacterized protein LOC142767387 isoform X1 [Rhipicephalus microplus]|uniref:uncharacterized protein LOC142767387 isoform X1 n=1 Tax=Rhipicephalus microplus TaxID=6941 RepID=UPI003F6D8979